MDKIFKLGLLFLGAIYLYLLHTQQQIDNKSQQLIDDKSNRYAQYLEPKNGFFILDKQTGEIHTISHQDGKNIFTTFDPVAGKNELKH